MTPQSTHIAHCLLAIAMLAAAIARADTVLIAHFDGDINPDYVGVPAATKAPSPDAAEGAISFVPGRFGKAVRLERLTAAALAYSVKDALTGAAGTVEFWYRPEWDTKTRLADDEPPDWLRGHPVLVTFFSNMSAGSGVELRKNQYNVLSFRVSRRYKTICSVMRPADPAFSRAGHWVHMAVSWDRDEARLFIDGRLLAISNDWLLDYFQSPLRLGGRSGGTGAFDELRISDRKIYVSSFPLRQQPFDTGGGEQAPSPPPPPPRLREPDVTFVSDFRGGAVANVAAGEPLGITNRPLTYLAPAEGSGVRLQRHEGSVGDTLAFETARNLNPFLGSARIVFRLSAAFRLPFTVFDSSHVASWRGTRVGVSLVVTEDSCLEWRSLNRGVVSRVTSPPLTLAPGEVVDVGCSWANSEVALYRSGSELVREMEAVVPPRIGRYVFIGSDSRGEHTLEGRVERVAIGAGDRLTEAAQ